TWKRLKALSKSGPPPEPHCYQPGDWMYVCHHRQETLEPRWKGPFLVVLMTPIVLKVDSISAWVHYTHTRPACLFALREEFLPQWKAELDKTNPLKLKL
ncbi:hypothetical protein K5549_020169, partial [Capra hircus]